MKEVVIGFLGGGNIGGCVYRLLEDMKEDIRIRCDVSIRVKKVLVKDFESFIPNGIPESILTIDKADVLQDPEISLVAEFMGGEHPAADFMLEALNNGKSAVTANKVALALNWDKLQAAAQAHGVGLYYEASVGGAVPVIAVLRGSLQSNRIDKLMSIINGTTNYILSRMYKNGEDYDLVLKDAQRLGLAEPNPAFDVEGMDAAYKLSIMASLAFHGRVTYDKVYREGITGVTAEDIACGRDMGYVLKLLAIAKRDGCHVETRVHPTFVPMDHPLARVDGSLNAVTIHGNSCEDMTLQGYGAGTPTASAVVSDILNAVTAKEHSYTDFPNTHDADESLNFTDNWETRYFIRINAIDAPGVLAAVANAFGQEQVSIATMQQTGAAGDDNRVMLTFITHVTREQSMKAALRRLNPAICKVESMIRVEE